MNNFDRAYTRRSSRVMVLLRSGVLIRLLCIFAGVFVLLAGGTAHGQSRESGNAGDIYLWVGGGASGYYIQYGQVKNLGVTAYVDADTIRRFGMEAEGRWLEFHQTNEIHADTYLVGPRYHFNANRLQPYVKALAGIGHFTFPYNYAHGSYLVIGPGAGLDYRMSRRWSVRADFEYQFWPQFTFGAMSSGGATVGVRYLMLK